MPDSADKRLPVGASVLAGVLLAIPVVLLIGVPLFSRDSPEVWGFPFFYWFQLFWVFLSAGLTWAAYVVIERARANPDVAGRSVESGAHKAER
ncbi:MAG: DUF3311 domain-containing protein [Nocardioidaceae bacterium]